MKSLEKYAYLFFIQATVPFFLALTLFFMPISSTGKSIALVLSVIAILVIPNYRVHLSVVIKQPWCIACLLLFGLALMACCWSPATHVEKLFVLEKYSKLLYLPLLVVGFSVARVRMLSLHAFLLAMLLTSLIAILKFHGFLESWNVNVERVFRNHIMTGFMAAFASYLSFMLFIQTRKQGVAEVASQTPFSSRISLFMGFKPRLLQFFYLSLAVIYSYHVLFVNGGRTGYVIYFMLMMLLVMLMATWRGVGVGMVIVSAVFVLSYTQSAGMHRGIHAAIHELQAYQSTTLDKNTSIGYRLQFHDFAKMLFSQHPIMGNGTASFTWNFRTINPVPSWFRKENTKIPGGLLEPHSQYWLVAAEFGLFGLMVFGFFFIALSKSIWQLSSMKMVGLGMLLLFFTGNLSDSLLFYSGSGYFFLLFMAICLGEQIDARPQLPRCN